MTTTFETRRTEPVHEVNPPSGDVVRNTQSDVSRRQAGQHQTGQHQTLRHETWPTRMVGPKYAPHDSSAPIYDGRDMAGLVAGTIITLGPLAAFSLGF